MIRLCFIAMILAHASAFTPSEFDQVGEAWNIIRQPVPRTCTNPAPPICANNKACIQLGVPLFDQELNLGLLKTAAQDTNYACKQANYPNKDLCVAMLPVPGAQNSCGMSPPSNASMSWRAANSMLCAPTSAAMVVQGMLNYYPCDVVAFPDTDLASSFSWDNATNPSIDAIYAEFLKMGTSPECGTGGSGMGDIPARARNFVNGSGAEWFSGANGGAVSQMVSNFEAGFLQVSSHGWYIEKDESLMNYTIVSFIRNGGHLMAPVGFLPVSHPLSQQTPGSLVDPEAIARLPYILLVNNPEIPTLRDGFAPSTMAGGWVCRINGVPANCTKAKYGGGSLVDVQLPSGALSQDFYDYQEFGVGESFTTSQYTFIEAMWSLGIVKLSLVPGRIVGGVAPVTVAQNLQITAARVPAPPAGDQKKAESEADQVLARPGLLAAGEAQAVAALLGDSGWGKKFARLYIVPKAHLSTAEIFRGAYLAAAQSDVGGFASGLNQALDRLSREPGAQPPELRWPWLHPRHGLKALLLRYAAGISQMVPGVESKVMAAAQAELDRTPDVPVIADPDHVATEEERDIGRSLAGALLVPVVAYDELLSRAISERDAIQLTVRAFQHQPHFSVRNAMRNRFAQRFPASVAELNAALGEH